MWNHVYREMYVFGLISRILVGRFYGGISLVYALMYGFKQGDILNSNNHLHSFRVE